MGLRLRLRPCPRCSWAALPDPVSNAIRWRRSGHHAQSHCGSADRRGRRPRIRARLRRSGAGAYLSRTTGLKALGLLVLGVVALLVPVIAPDPATTNVAVFTMMYVGLATAWNIMGGYTGYISLGHAAFFGFGAYSFGLL